MSDVICKHGNPSRGCVSCLAESLTREAIPVPDQAVDNAIRCALKDADKKGKLGVVAAVTGIAGGEDELRKIMNSTGELHVMDRGMLRIHLGL